VHICVFGDGDLRKDEQQQDARTDWGRRQAVAHHVEMPG
jgi:hypothetical protein